MPHGGLEGTVDLLNILPSDPAAAMGTPQAHNPTLGNPLRGMGSIDDAINVLQGSMAAADLHAQLEANTPAPEPGAACQFSFPSADPYSTFCLHLAFANAPRATTLTRNFYAVPIGGATNLGALLASTLPRSLPQVEAHTLRQMQKKRRAERREKRRGKKLGPRMKNPNMVKAALKKGPHRRKGKFGPTPL